MPAVKKLKKKTPIYSEIAFTRSEVAEILGCTPLTIANREKKLIYPEPQRVASSNFRTYSLVDILYLQMLTFGVIKINHIYSKMYDKGYVHPENATKAMNEALQLLKTEIDNHTKALPEVVLQADTLDGIDLTIKEATEISAEEKKAPTVDGIF